MPTFETTDLSVAYRSRDGDVTAVDRVSFEIREEEIFGIVGESGCGKSTLASSILNLLDSNGEIVGGEIRYGDTDLTALTDTQLSERIRGKEISMVFQDPSSSLDPVYTVGQQLIETVQQHFDVSKAEARQQAIEILDDVGIPSPEDRLDDYPHQFSGGMQQRVVIAIALACDPGLLIADEPTTGLDVSIQAQVLDLLEEINETNDVRIMIITHDLGVIAEICDRVGVMYAGNMVEIGDVEDIFASPKHPYTRALMESVPRAHEAGEDLSVVEGTPPDLENPPEGCKFNPRCTEVCSDACETGDIPPLYRANGTAVRCYLYDEQENEAYDGETEILAEPGGPQS